MPDCSPKAARSACPIVSLWFMSVSLKVVLTNKLDLPVPLAVSVTAESVRHPAEALLSGQRFIQSACHSANTRSVSLSLIGLGVE